MRRDTNKSRPNVANYPCACLPHPRGGIFRGKDALIRGLEAAAEVAKFGVVNEIIVG